MRELEYPFDSAYLLQKKRALKKQLLLREDLLTKKIAILSGSTVGEMKHMLELFLLNHGICPEFWEGQYDRYYEEVMFDNAELLQFGPDVIYIHTSNKNIVGFPAPSAPEEEVQAACLQVYGRLAQVWEKIREDYHCPVIQNNFEPLPYRLMGNYDVSCPSGGRSFINRLNDKLYAYAQAHDDFYINDLEYEAAVYGLDQWFDAPMWCMYKYAFAVDAIPWVAHNISNIIKSIYGKNKKALALDLDNTLWGGVIGDDGVENIKIGIESPEGMAYEEFQQYLKRLSFLGIALNVCSKNEEDISLTGFTHPASVLKRDDFIVYKANWNNKDGNVREIAEALHIMPESVVFLDDNPMERDLVRAGVPEAAVPELGQPEYYTRYLDRSGFFEVTALSEDDRKRNAYFKANQSREESLSRFVNYADYLKSLEMRCHIEPFGVHNIQRVTQLINKSNQFNPTTRRYSMEEITQKVNDADCIAFCGQLSDKYGDNGIVSVVMAQVEEDCAHIDLWVMSCRVLKRDMELAMLDELVRLCRERGISRILGYYYRTKKNKLVEHLYGDMGFECREQDEAHSIWEYCIPETYENKNQVISPVQKDGEGYEQRRNI